MQKEEISITLFKAQALLRESRVSICRNGHSIFWSTSSRILYKLPNGRMKLWHYIVSNVRKLL